MTYDIIGQPVYKTPHECELPKINVPRHRRPEGVHNKTIIQCRDCGKRWYSIMYADDNCAYANSKWYELRWYNFKIKSYIFKGGN